jgi:hypothetical protein
VATAVFLALQLASGYNLAALEALDAELISRS